jgi:hypothetical protein
MGELWRWNGHRTRSDRSQEHTAPRRLNLPDPHRFRNASCGTPISFSGSQWQATLSRSFGALQGLGISRSRHVK